MRRHLTVVAVALTVTASLMLAGCGSATAQWREAGAAATNEPVGPTTAATQTPPPVPSNLSKKDLTLTTDGVGPFKIGKSTIGSLTGDGLITQITPYFPEFCTGIQAAFGAGDWSGLVTLYFKDESAGTGTQGATPTATAGPAEPPPGAVLVAVATLHSAILSGSGAHVGMTGDEVKAIYKARVQESQGLGGMTVYTVTVDPNQRLVMRTDPGQDTITEMFAQRGNEPPLLPQDGPAC